MGGKHLKHDEAINMIIGQLPESMRDRFVVTLRSDAFMIAPRVLFCDKRGNKWETSVDNNLTLPRTFLALLCVVD